MAAKVTFKADRCKGCELCTTVCPKHIVVIDNSVVNRKGYHPATVTDMDACIGCASCAKICPGDIPVDATANILPKISDKVYTGEALVSGLENTYAYTVEELGERINFGQQTVRVTLNDGYVWADGDTNKTKEFTWNITQEVNNWKVEPYLSHTAWPQVFASTVNFKFTAPQTSFGVLQAELSKDGTAPQSFSGTLPTEPGSYTLRYWVEGHYLKRAFIYLLGFAQQS